MPKSKKLNLNCPVPGCQTTVPHLNDPNIQSLVREFGDPEKACRWTLYAIAELGKSIRADMDAERWLAVFSRSRQIEELYIRTLYTVFIASPDEIAHIMSDDQPNGLTARYRKVNEVIFEGRGTLDTVQPGLTQGEFTPMETLHQGAHVSFSALLLVIGLVRNPEYLEVYKSGRYEQHFSIYCTFLNHLANLFHDERDKATVLSALISMSRPKSYRIEQAGKPVKAGPPPVKLLKTVFLSKGEHWRALFVDQPSGEEVRFRVHISKNRCSDEKNMAVLRRGPEADMLAALDFDIQSAVKEGWAVEGS